MKYISTEHTKAFLTNFEMACEFSAITVAADLIWVAHDILINGLAISYVVIAVLLLIGLIGTIYVLYRHHKAYVHRLSRKKDSHKRDEVIAFLQHYRYLRGK